MQFVRLAELSNLNQQHITEDAESNSKYFSKISLAIEAADMARGQSLDDVHDALSDLLSALHSDVVRNLVRSAGNGAGELKEMIASVQSLANIIEEFERRLKTEIDEIADMCDNLEMTIGMSFDHHHEGDEGDED